MIATGHVRPRPDAGRGRRARRPRPPTSPSSSSPGGCRSATRTPSSARWSASRSSPGRAPLADLVARPSRPRRRGGRPARSRPVACNAARRAGGGGPAPVAEQRERFRAHLVDERALRRLDARAPPGREPCSSPQRRGSDGRDRRDAHHGTPALSSSSPAALVAVVALVVIAQLNGLLAGSRVDGGVAGSVTTSRSRCCRPAARRGRRSCRSWGPGRPTTPRWCRPSRSSGTRAPLATANAVLRLGRVPPHPGVRHLRPHAPAAGPARGRHRRPASRCPRAIVGPGAVVVPVRRRWPSALVADELENVVQSRLIDQAWDGRPLDGRDVRRGRRPGRSGSASGWCWPRSRWSASGRRSPVVRPLLRTSWFALAAPRAARRARLERPGRRRGAPLGPRPDAVERALRRAPGRVDRPGRLSGLPDRPDAGHRPRPRASRSAPHPRPGRRRPAAAGRGGAGLPAGRQERWTGGGCRSSPWCCWRRTCSACPSGTSGRASRPSTCRPSRPRRRPCGRSSARCSRPSCRSWSGIAVVRPSIVDVFATDDGSWFDRDMAALILGG